MLVTELPLEGSVPLFRHPEWTDRFPWLFAGVTGPGEDDDRFDLGLFGDASTGGVQARWAQLGRATGFERLVHGRQVHGARVTFHREGPPGLLLVPATDGHATRTEGLLLTVSVADCVPVYLVDERLRAAALLHAGWRGTAAGILERGVAVLAERLASDPDDLHLHLGPAICGECYEVGPEVHAALGRPEPTGPEPVDLRAVLAERGRAQGIGTERTTVSTHCTRCGDAGFFSHRGGAPERQLGLLGLR